ncbi:hypothetical protein [Mesorhizobium sp. WSM2239]|uniref:Uncharacterized protein n=1 Tax=Mesorhizobium sp. WSM2239 TaxID=3228852 RepID=A0AAU8D6V9_9HYPH
MSAMIGRFFAALPNSETGLLPAAAQGATFQLSNTENPAIVRITGFGLDSPGPNFGAGGQRDATNQTQQTHVGALSGNTGGANSGKLQYSTDTKRGNSGSPVIVEAETWQSESTQTAAVQRAVEPMSGRASATKLFGRRLEMACEKRTGEMLGLIPRRCQRRSEIHTRLLLASIGTF